ncbi:MAG: VWA domain-containing protein [Acidobacteria bacterium]|nr:MAG: VWA domain-containing protein [Acidobacteriota bacterium]
MRKAIAIAMLGIAATGVSAFPGGQQAPPAQEKPQVTFRTAIDAVTVDVIVTDKQGNPVTDLTAADFEIKENNKLQTIDNFKRIALTEDRFDPDPAKAAPILSMESMEREAARDDVRLVTVFLDDYHTRRGNAMAVREKVAKFVTELDPRDLVAVLYPLTPTLGITFSRDHEGIANAIRKFDGRKYDYQPKYPQEQIYYRLSRPQIEELRNSIVIDALEGLCVYLGTLRQGRKTVLMVSEGMSASLPIEIESGGLVQSTPNSTAAINRDRADFQAASSLLMRMKDIFSAATRTNTSIYTLDPRGLATGEFDLSDSSPVPFESDRKVLNETTDNLRVIADQTDGRAIVGRNDPTPALRQMLKDTSAYYLLGYTSTEAPRDGKFHEIKLSVKRKGLDVRYRKGYWAMSAENIERSTKGPDKPALATDLAEALAAVAEPERGHPVRTWVGFDKGEDGKSQVTLVWEAAPNASPAEAPEQMNVVATFVTGDMLFRGKVARDPNAVTPSGKVSFASPPGAMRLRLTAEGPGGALIDSEDKELVVPDYTKVGPTVTSPQIFRARTARELQNLRQAASPSPSTSRDFSRTEQILIRFKAYGPGGTPPKLTVRLLNSVGETMSTFPPAEPRADGVIDLPFSLGGLVTGTYLIEIEAASSDLKSRTVIGFRISN